MQEEITTILGKYLLIVFFKLLAKSCYYILNFKYKSGFLEDKTMAEKLIYITNDIKQNCPFCGLQLVETFNQPKFRKSTQSLEVND